MTDIVTGFYTPNYQPLADRLAANLDEHGIAHHLYAVSAAEWAQAILLKPEIIKRARAEHPGVTVIFMDVDCIVRGPIEPATQIDADVALYFRVKQLSRKRKTVWSSSRLTVWRDTPGAAALLDRWHDLCRSSLSTGHTEFDDEDYLMRAISQASGSTIAPLPMEYAAREHDEVGPEAVIVHKSQHATTRPLWPVQRWLKVRRRKIVSAIVGKSYNSWKYGDAA